MQARIRQSEARAQSFASEASAPEASALGVPALTGPSSAELLVAAEGRMLAAGSKVELRHVALREAGTLVPSGLVLWVGRAGRLLATSSNGKADRNTSFAQDVERDIKDDMEEGVLVRRAIRIEGLPFSQVMIAPFADASGGLVFLNVRAFGGDEAALAERMSRLAGLVHRGLGARPARRGRRLWPGAVAGLMVLGALPVPMSTLAPAEVVAANPRHVAAPFAGVVETIAVEPYARVRAGEVLVRLDTTEADNAAELAARERAVALARADVAGRAAFADAQARREVAVAVAEAELARVREAHAEAARERAVLRAPVDGVAMFASTEDWEGRPLATGETVIEIADPGMLELKLHVPMDGGEPLVAGARVKLFLDADPANAVEATITRAAMRASAREDGQMGFEARASLRGGANLGARGVAKIYGEPAPMVWWLARKPVTALRQMVGI